MTTTDPTEPTEPTSREELEEDWRRALTLINRRWGQMPYGASAQFAYFDATDRKQPSPGRLEALELIGDNLDRLIAVLKRVAAGNEEERAELGALRRWLAGAGELGLRMVALAEEAEAVEAGPVAGTVTRQREALEAIHATIVETITPDRPELERIGTLAMLALAAGTPAEDASR